MELNLTVATISDARRAIDLLKRYIEQQDDGDAEQMQDARPIECLPLDRARTANVLLTEGIRSIGQLEKFSRHDLLKLPGMGRQSLADIETALKRIGRSLRAD